MSIPVCVYLVVWTFIVALITNIKKVNLNTEWGFQKSLTEIQIYIHVKRMLVISLVVLKMLHIGLESSLYMLTGVSNVAFCLLSHSSH